jgi:hypothetical protein
MEGIGAAVLTLTEEGIGGEGIPVGGWTVPETIVDTRLER